MTTEPVTTPIRVLWAGVTRAGQDQFGSVAPDDLAAWVEARFERGWRALVVWRARPGEWLSYNPPQDAEILAEILRHPDDGHLTWWSE